MEVLSKSTEETKELAGKIASQLAPGDVLALHGDLGSGKTTFVGYLVYALGISARVQSPTFVLVRKYSGENSNPAGISVVNHVDLYRLTEEASLEDVGLGELFTEKNAVTVIEWPELAQDYLPENAKKVYFEYVDEDIRKISSNGFEM